MAAAGSGKGPPNLNYVKGRIITVAFVDKAVSTVNVVDQASGVYLEPTTASATTANPRPPAQNPSPTLPAAPSTRRRDP
jgi:hypothetical protein